MMWIRFRLIKQMLGNLWLSNDASQVTTLWNNYQSLVFFQLFNNEHSTLHSMDNLVLEFSLVKAKIGTKTIKMSLMISLWSNSFFQQVLEDIHNSTFMRLVSIYLIQPIACLFTHELIGTKSSIQTCIIQVIS